VQPPHHILFLNIPHQQRPAPLALLQRHGQRLKQGVGHVLGAVGIDQNGLAHRLGRPGKAREDEDARIFRVLCAATYSLATRFMPSRKGVTSPIRLAR
jgi:hypothetical protein